MPKLVPFVRGDSYLANRNGYIPFVLGNGYTRAEDVIGPPAEYATAGPSSIASFTTLRAAPVSALSVAINPVQSGSGDPAPDNVRPISGWTEAKVTRTGRNLLALPIVPYTTVNPYQSDTSFSASDYMWLKAGTYVLSYSCAVAHRWFVKLIDKAGTPLSDNAYNPATGSYYNSQYKGWIRGSDSTAGSHTLTITIVKDCYVRILRSFTNPDTIEFANCQLEYGSTAHAYEAYSGTTLTIDLDGTRYGGTLDVLTGVLTVDKVAVTIDGDTLKANDIYSFSPNVRTKTNYPAGLTGKYNSTSTFCLSDKLKPNYLQVIGNPANATELCVYPHSSGIMVTFLASTGVTTKALADAWFAENTPMVCYELATPITVQLDPETLSTLAGENNIWADTGDTTVTYRSN